MKYAVLIGRILFSFIFIMAIIGHFSNADIAFARAAGVPLANVAVPLSGILAFIGGLSIAFGFKAKWGAWLIIIFLIPVTFIMHAFWAAPDKMEAQMQMANFFKNISIIGGALLIAYFGSGPLSIDARLNKQSSK